MPHVVLNGTISVEEIFDKLNPVFIRNDECIIKTKEAYLEKNKKDILVDSLVIEKGKRTGFLALISGRDDGVVVRLYPQLEIEKTDGVKKVLAELAKQVMQTFPEMHVGETNLQDHI